MNRSHPDKRSVGVSPQKVVSIEAPATESKTVHFKIPHVPKKPKDASKDRRIDRDCQPGPAVGKFQYLKICRK